MRDANVIERFQRRMIELGCPERKVQRAARELTEHYEDLKGAALEEGLTDAVAGERAAALLGEPIALAERAAEGLRHSSWWGRHRVMGFCILAPLGFAPAWLLCIMVTGAVFWLVKLATGSSVDTWATAMMLQIGKSRGLLLLAQTVMNASVIGIFAVFLCWLARRSAAGFKWAVIGCCSCAIHGWFFRISLSAHWLSVGYHWRPNWVCVITPLLVAAGGLLIQRRREMRPFVALAVTLLFVGLLSGCATPHEAVSQRGWIGGDYKQARRANFFNAVFPSPAVAPGLPRELATNRSAAIIVSGVRTNTPAGIADLHSGDFILELNHRPVTRLRDFRRIIDQCQPGSTVTVKAYRDGQWFELPVLVGKETFRPGGVFSLTFPSVVHGWDLWLNPGLSFVIAGYEPNPGLRHQLGDSKEVYDEEWKAFAGIFEISNGKRVLAQESHPN